MPMEAVLERGRLELISSESILRILRLILIGSLLICTVWSAGNVRIDNRSIPKNTAGNLAAVGMTADKTEEITTDLVNEIVAVHSSDIGTSDPVEMLPETLAVASPDIVIILPVNTATAFPSDVISDASVTKTPSDRSRISDIIPSDTIANVPTDIPTVTPDDRGTDVPADIPAEIEDLANVPVDIPTGVDDPADIPADIPATVDDSTDTSTDTEEPAEDPAVETQVIRGFMVNDSGCITGYQDPMVAKSGILALPEDAFCTSVGSNAFAGLEDICTEIYIPANITWIEPDAFAGLSNVFYIEVVSDNPAYYSDCGILYSVDGEVVCYPGAR